MELSDREDAAQRLRLGADCQNRVGRLRRMFSELDTLPAEIKKKMWLYHYQPGHLPDAKEHGFQGFVKKGQVFEY